MVGGDRDEWSEPDDTGLTEEWLGLIEDLWCRCGRVCVSVCVCVGNYRRQYTITIRYQIGL